MIRKVETEMIWTGKKVYDKLTNTYSTGYWIQGSKGNWYPVWNSQGAEEKKVLYDECIYALRDNKCSECNDFYQCSVCDYFQQRYEQGRADAIDEFASCVLTELENGVGGDIKDYILEIIPILKEHNNE